MTSLARPRRSRVPNPQIIKRRAGEKGGWQTAARLHPESSRPLSAVPYHFNFKDPAPPSPCENGAAFSLVELLAVVGIMAVLAIGAVPILRGLGDSQSARGAAMSLVSTLEQARSAAILSGTEVYLAFPDRTFPLTNYRSNSYVLLRRKVTNSGGPNDDFLTNQAANWIVLSKWERLPGTLVFSLSGMTNRLSVDGLAIPGNPNWRGQLARLSFNPAGSLNADSALRLLFAPSNVISNGAARVADSIEITRFSGRVRYAGVTNNATNF